MVVDAAVLWRAYDAARSVVTSPIVRTRWSEPSVVRGYSVGGLVAHVVSATERLADVLEADPPAPASVRLVGLPEFYGANRIESEDEREGGLHGFLVADGARRAEAGPDEVVAAFAALEARLRPLLDAAGADRLVPVVQVREGAARLDDYLVTRIVELVVHADDLACSVDLPDLVLPDDVVATVTRAFVGLAVARSGALAGLRGFARRARGGGGGRRGR
jgi:hypothetical protein